MCANEPIQSLDLRADAGAIAALLERLEADNRRVQACGDDGLLERLIDVLVDLHRLAQALDRRTAAEEAGLTPGSAELARLRIAREEVLGRRESLRRLATEEEPMSWSERQRRIDRAVADLARIVRAQLGRPEPLPV